MLYVHRQIFTDFKGSAVVSLQKAQATSCHAHVTVILLLHIFSFFSSSQLVCHPLLTFTLYCKYHSACRPISTPVDKAIALQFSIPVSF